MPAIMGITTTHITDSFICDNIYYATKGIVVNYVVKSAMLPVNRCILYRNVLNPEPLMTKVTSALSGAYKKILCVNNINATSLDIY